MNNEEALLKLRAIKTIHHDKVFFKNINDVPYVINTSINDIKNGKPNEHHTMHEQLDKSKSVKVTVFVSDNPGHTLESVKNITADIILFYPTNLDLFIPFLNKLNKKLGTLIDDNKKALYFLCPKKQFFLVEYLFGSGYFKRKIAHKLKVFLEYGNYKRRSLSVYKPVLPLKMNRFDLMRALDKNFPGKFVGHGYLVDYSMESNHEEISSEFNAFVQNSVKQKKLNCRCIPFGFLFGAFVIKVCALSKKKSIPAGILYIIGWLYYTN